jgi:hypothetical protein
MRVGYLYNTRITESCAHNYLTMNSFAPLFAEIPCLRGTSIRGTLCGRRDVPVSREYAADVVAVVVVIRLAFGISCAALRCQKGPTVIGR